jgi:DNA-binding PadR family transcriptional regulator
MAKRRKVGNLMALAVLSALVERPMHPYEMASMLRARGKDHDMKIKWGSLYTVVGNLEKHGLIAATENVRQGGRPERTVYEITGDGRAELADWLRELLATPEPEQPRFAAALSFMAVLPPDDVTALLRERLTALTEAIAADRAALTAVAQEVPRLFLVESEYDLAIRQAEATWLRSLLDELADESFPGLADWRQYHLTGRMPDELAELARRGSTEDGPTE